MKRYAKRILLILGSILLAAGLVTAGWGLAMTQGDLGSLRDENAPWYQTIAISPEGFVRIGIWFGGHRAVSLFEISLP
ncbi:MAG: hypothetical protein ACLRVT_09395 [Oscillospiraceae bacterium]